MKNLLLFFLIFITMPAEEKANFEKYKKPLDTTICKTQKNAECLAYKYVQHYHPNAKNADWFRNTSINHYFDYKVNYQNEREKGDIQFSFQSYSDGLEWKYWEDSVIIRIKDPLKLIEHNNVAKKIKDKLESKFDENYQLEKVTKTVNRNLQQSQTTPKEYYSIKEEIIYKVRANGKNILFNVKGDVID